MLFGTLVTSGPRWTSPIIVARATVAEEVHEIGPLGAGGEHSWGWSPMYHKRVADASATGPDTRDNSARYR